MSFDIHQRIALKDKFQDLLCEAAQHRDARDYTVTGPDGWPEMAWAAFERNAMMTAVTLELAQRGITDEEVSPERIWREAELEAIGHSDYAHTYALYCTRIVERAVRRVESAA